MQPFDVLLEEICGVDEGGEFLELEVPDVKVGKLLVQKVAELARGNPAVVAGILFSDLNQCSPDRFQAHVHAGGACGSRIFLTAFHSSGLVRHRRQGRLIRVVQEINVGELAADGDEVPWRLLLAHAEDIDLRLVEVCGEMCEIRVRGDNAEAVKTSLIEQIHGVDDGRRI